LANTTITDVVSKNIFLLIGAIIKYIADLAKHLLNGGQNINRNHMTSGIDLIEQSAYTFKYASKHLE
jgi:hypothetical protein